MLLVACSPKIPDSNPVALLPYVPSELRSCPRLPTVPTDAADTQRDVATYVTRLHQVAVTCKVRLNQVDDILLQAEATVVPGDGFEPPTR